ncbi:MAG: RibD family protein [Chitinophagaceae bacterium]
MQQRPYIICLMMTSLDGKILADKWGDSDTVQRLSKSFEEIHEEIGINAWIVGRKTMERDFTKGAEPVLKEGAPPVPRTDFVADPAATSFAIAIDPKAKLGWHRSTMQGDHVITVLTEEVSDAYLANLQDIGVSYIFAGKSGIDLHTATKKLYTLFGIEKLMLEGGGLLNGSFLNEGLVDEFNQLLLPIVDGSAENSSVFEIPKKKNDSTLFKLEEIKKLPDDILWLKYKTATV